MASLPLLKVLVVGDVMLGRLVDQLFPEHNTEHEDSKYVKSFLKRISQGHYLSHNYVWGNILYLFHEADVRLINLETSVTTHPEKWPDKAFNYRMHPANLKCLKEANIDYCSLANNHTLDYSLQGMLDTTKALKENGIKFAGVGKNLFEAQQPAIVSFSGINMACFSFADHYKMWAAKEDSPGINFVSPSEVNEEFYVNFRNQVDRVKKEEDVQLVTVSFHWGSNYSWEPPLSFVSLAHNLIDKCDVDLIHGHSSHHVQGLEIYKKKIILYGCGDFVDDYAVDETYRNDLSFAYNLFLDPETRKWKKMELIPTRIQNFQVNRAESYDRDWLLRTMKGLSGKFGTNLLVDDRQGYLWVEI